MAAQDVSRVTDVWVSCGQTQVADEEIHSMVVDLDVDQPDMCVLTVNNASHKFSNEVRLADPMEVKIGGSGGTAIFKGEVVGLEPIYKTGGESRCIVRGFNRLHRLLRGRKSRTFAEQKDSAIAQAIASENGLSAKVDDTAVVHKHVYQHNQTDLEFLRVLAARNGYEVVVEDKTLHFRKPRADRDSGVELRINDQSSGKLLKQFSPRLSSAGLVKEVEVRSWNPEKKEEIVARASASTSSLGKRIAPANAAAFGEKITFTVDRPVASVEEAKKLAEAKLNEILMDYIAGDGLAIGHPEIKAGIVVKIIVNPDDPSDRFNGKYYIVGASHRYSHSGTGGGGGDGSGGGGYVTAIRVRRDAEGGQ
ncbi:MAG TPA: contractile injection system protein, VgrG/Pvc8 family [Kofleriaceae bacterium]|nr:contractile injection system protein, VgrG/Pvc8 family [Kofleriaceae bacterium]